MREILFKGKRKDNGEWVEGWLVGKTCKTILSEAEVSAQIVDNDLVWHEVIPGTVGQYTGLTDINGVKIFEGDVIQKCSDNKDNEFIHDFGRVFWYPPWARFVFKAFNFQYQSIDMYNKYEVIGNAYD